MSCTLSANSSVLVDVLKRTVSQGCEHVQQDELMLFWRILFGVGKFIHENERVIILQTPVAQILYHSSNLREESLFGSERQPKLPGTRGFTLIFGPLLLHNVPRWRRVGRGPAPVVMIGRAIRVTVVVAPIAKEDSQSKPPATHIAHLFE